MAGFRTHIGVSTALGVGYGAAAANPLGHHPEAAFLAAGLTAVGGMLPDLDSDSGVPVRELSGLAAAVLPTLLIPRLTAAGSTSTCRPSARWSGGSTRPARTGGWRGGGRAWRSPTAPGRPTACRRTSRSTCG